MAFIDNSNFIDWPMGGMLEYELAILRALIEEYDVDLWGVSVDGQSPEYVEIGNTKKTVNVYCNVHTKKKIIPNYLQCLKIVNCKAFKKQKYDIVYAHTGSCFVGACMVIDKKNTILAYHQHGLSYKTNHSLFIGIQKPFYRLSQKQADVVFVVSDQESVDRHVRELRWKHNNKFVSVGSPINIDKFDIDLVKERIERAKDKINFIYVGRLSSEKNISAMIKAFGLYHKSNPKSVLNLVGDGPERENLEKITKNIKLDDSILFHGAVRHADVYPYLMDSDVFLISSNGEGVSVAVLEAFAAGLPVVCYKVPGLEKQNVNGVTGIVVKEHTSEAFSNAMSDVVGNIEYYANNCINEAKKYDYRIIASKISDAIKRIRK